MKTDLDMASRFLLALDQKGVFTFQTFGDRDKNLSLNRVLHGPVDQHVEELIRLNALGAGVFVMINEGDGVVHPESKTRGRSGARPRSQRTQIDFRDRRR